MSSSHTSYAQHSGAVDRAWPAIAIALFLVAALAASLSAVSPEPTVPDVRVGAGLHSGTPTIEDWRGNSASIRPAY